MTDRRSEKYINVEKSYLKDSTEALIMAAREQGLSKRSKEAGVCYTRQEARCRLCKDASEIVQYITAARC